jgi:hypothetical protein
LKHLPIVSAALLIAAPMQVRAQSPQGVWPNPGACSNISPNDQRRCIGRRVAAKQRSLERLYPRALAAVQSGFAKWGATDNRLHPRHFVRAHREWRQFVDSNCIAVGAFGGGSNSSVSDRITECYERELDERIRLYRQLADGTYGQ